MITAKEASLVLQEAFKQDPSAISQLINSRVNSAMPVGVAEDSPATYGMDSDGQLIIGVLGLINALVTDGYVAAHYGDDGKILGFAVVGSNGG